MKNNEDLAIVLQNEYETEFDEIISDTQLVIRAKELAIKRFNVNVEQAQKISIEVVKLYKPISLN